MYIVMKVVTDVPRQDPAGSGICLYSPIYKVMNARSFTHSSRPGSPSKILIEYIYICSENGDLRHSKNLNVKAGN